MLGMCLHIVWMYDRVLLVFECGLSMICGLGVV